MSKPTLIVLRDHSRQPEATPDATFMAFQDLRRQILSGQFWKLLFRYRDARLHTYRIRNLSKPFNTALLLRLLSRGACHFEDEFCNRLSITPAVLGKLAWRMLRDLGRKPFLVRRVKRDIESLARLEHAPRRLNWAGTPVYLRTDLVFAVKSGGSVGHIAGVLNHLDAFVGKPVFISSDWIPTVRDDIACHVVTPKSAYWDHKELPRYHYNQTFTNRAAKLLDGKQLAFIYQRYSINNYSGIELAGKHGVPLVLEYNGSEIWVNKNWGQALSASHEALSERIEMLNLRSADLVVVVSQALKNELIGRGIDGDKVLVNPNGVDPDRYSPAIDGSAIRARRGLADKTVIGFIGTFGRWHGVEVLADAFGRLLHEFPQYREHVRLLLIGDGVTMPEVQANLERWQVGAACICTGLVPQQEGPAHLAACDFLVSPHVPNPDGSEFFGSPTKLFEYMAMGKGIVASKLAQIGEVLRHDATAWLVPPGDVEALAHGMKRLLDDVALRQRLGSAARADAVAHHTWKEHTRKIIDRLCELYP